MQSLRISQFFSEKRQPSNDDLRRLRGGLQVVKRSLAAFAYLEEGVADGLEGTSLRDARFARNTLKALGEASKTPQVRAYLLQFQNTLETILNNVATVREDDLRVLERFFSMIGERMVSDVIKVALPKSALGLDPIPRGGEPSIIGQLSATTPLQSSYRPFTNTSELTSLRPLRIEIARYSVSLGCSSAFVPTSRPIMCQQMR
ncbi:MAG: hypothetical protein QOE82_2278 [Thermoanaerobaculia bacterium]|jgi:hypothetical protein|nr:hypothetical protein [Thermoanaerobaculia bacterium]